MASQCRPNVPESGICGLEYIVRCGIKYTYKKWLSADVDTRQRGYTNIHQEVIELRDAIGWFFIIYTYACTKENETQHDKY